MLCLQFKKPEFRFKIVLLDDRELKFTYKGSQKCEQILVDVSKLLNLDEREYFSFRYTDCDMRSVWVDLSKSISGQFKSIYVECNEIILYFNVKYFLLDPCKLNFELTRYLYYLQLRKDISTGKLPVAQFDFAVDLFAYFLQDELGDYSPKRDVYGYASEFVFMPNQTIELEKSAESKHAKLKGMAPSNTEINFLNKAKWLDMYGVDAYNVLVEDDGGGGGGNGGGAEQQEECLFAINPTGICIYKNGSKISSYFWPRINRVHYKANRLMLNVVDKTNEPKVFTFILKTSSECKHLWKTCVDSHKFFRIKTVYEEPAKISTTLATSKHNKNSTNANSDSSRNSICRVPARRVSRRQNDYLKDESKATHENKKPVEIQIINENGELIFKEPSGLEGRSSDDGNEFRDNNYEVLSSTSPTKSLKQSSRRRESATSEKDVRRKDRNFGRSRSRRSYEMNMEAKSKKKEQSANNQPDSDYSDNENKNLVDAANKRTSAYHRRSSSRGSNRLAHANSSRSKTRKSLNDLPNNEGEFRKQHHRQNGEEPTEMTCHETTMDEMDINEMEKRRQIRRRKRSKSPGGTGKLPDEILKHINYNLVESSGLTADQLREIPFVKVETTAPPFRISPHQKQRRYSPRRRKSQELHESKISGVTAATATATSACYIRDGTAQVVKTTSATAATTTTTTTTTTSTSSAVNKSTLNDRSDYVMVSVATKQSTVSMGSAVNSKLSHFSEPIVNVGFSADSGCEDMINLK